MILRDRGEMTRRRKGRGLGLGVSSQDPVAENGEEFLEERVRDKVGGPGAPLSSVLRLVAGRRGYVLGGQRRTRKRGIRSHRGQKNGFLGM